jgi:hypothetical protein
MTATREEAKHVAESLPVGFGLLEISVLISIIYYAYQLWKACYGTQTYAMGDDGNHDQRLFRLAAKRVRRAAKYHKAKLSKDDAATLTKAALDHAAALPEARYMTCCTEPFAAEAGAVMIATAEDDDEDDE